MALTDLKVRNAKPTDKPQKLFDANGLFLYIPKATKTGKPVKKTWRFKYSFNKVEKLISIGGYPALSLSDARNKRDEFRALILEGINPAEVRKQNKNPEGKSFKEAAIEWIEFKSIPDTKRCWKPTHSAAVLKTLQREVFPTIGDKVITTITSEDIDSVINPIVSRGALEVAERALSSINAVFRYALHKSYVTNNPAFGENEFLPSSKVQHMAHLSLEQLPEFFSELENYQGDFVCKSAVKFTMLTLARTDEIRFAK